MSIIFQKRPMKYTQSFTIDVRNTHKEELTTLS